MLYLFGQLALSDALYYHEDYQGSNYPPALASTQHSAGPRPDEQAAAVGRRLRRNRHLPQASRAAGRGFGDGREVVAGPDIGAVQARYQSRRAA